MAGLNTSFDSHKTFVFNIGSIKLPLPGPKTGLTLSNLVKGKIAQLSVVSTLTATFFWLLWQPVTVKAAAIHEMTIKFSFIVDKNQDIRIRSQDNKHKV